MTTSKAKTVLEGIKPKRPQRKETRDLTEAVEMAIHALTFYEDFIRVARGEE